MSLFFYTECLPWQAYNYEPAGEIKEKMVAKISLASELYFILILDMEEDGVWEDVTAVITC
jgi:hypothetical protein